jgi:hypothetical protein
MRYAVVFTTYTWDAFVARQYERVRQRMGSGDLYVIADETHGSLGEIKADHVMRTTQSEILGRDGVGPFVESQPVGKKSLLWWNLDYLTYRFFSEHQEYDYCITMDYDACINMNIDDLIDQISARKIDFVAHRHIQDMNGWMWMKPHQATYPGDQIEGRLLCVTVISRAAANFLAHQRQVSAVAYSQGQMPYWPFCEVFMPTELKRAGFVLAELSEFGDIAQYGWRPAYRESTAAYSTEGSFVHPVLDDERLLKSLVAEHYPLSDFLKAGSDVRQQLRSYVPSAYLPLLGREIWKRFLNRLHRATRAA